MRLRLAHAVALLLLVCPQGGFAESTRTKTRRPSRTVQPKAAPKSSAARGPAQRWLREMSLRDKIAQLVMIPCFGESPSTRSTAYRDFARAVRDLRVGGIIVINRVAGGTVRSAEPYAMATFLNRMQKLARVPLLVGGDFERGASMRVSNTTKFPHLMAYGAARDLRLTSALGSATAREARALGVQWVFAPDADVNNNPDNPIINIRSFGENPQDVAAQVKAFIEGAKSDPANPVLVTVKHFPGHGDTSVDSHMDMPSLTADRLRLDTVEFVPFRAAIEAGVDAIMSAHMTAPALGAEQDPSTVSKAVLTGVLRDQFKFEGLIVTDAMNMAGLTKQFPGGEAAVRAVEAGADVLLMPPDLETAIKAVMAAVREGRLSERRINESVIRILNAKIRVGLNGRKLVNVETISDVLESPELAAQAQMAADKAVTLVKNERGLIPLSKPDQSCLYILSESRYGQQGRRLLEEAHTRGKGMRATLFDPQLSTADMDQSLADNSTGCQVNVVASFITVGAFRGDMSLSGNYPEFVRRLFEQPAPVVWVSLGSPYLLKTFPQASAYLATFSPVPTSEAAAAKALFGEIPITGRLPVSIPGIAKYGEGIQLRAR